MNTYTYTREQWAVDQVLAFQVLGPNPKADTVIEYARKLAEFANNGQHQG